MESSWDPRVDCTIATLEWYIQPVAFDFQYVGTSVQLWDGGVNITQINASRSEIAGRNIAIYFADNLPTLLEDLMINVTVSLMSLINNPLPPLLSENASAHAVTNILVPAVVTSYPTVYIYDKEMLWQVYGITLGVSALSILLGCYTLFRNSVTGDFSFSQVLVTTRNQTLDGISEGAELGGEYIHKELLKNELQYGLKDGKPCFGFKGEIEPLNAKLN